LPADTTSAKTVFTAGSNGSEVLALNLSSTDTATRIVQIALVRSGTSYPLGALTLPITAGTDGVTPSVDAIASGVIPGLPINNDGQHYIPMKSGDTLTVNTTTTVTTAKAISAVAMGGDL
jgi:hypothetical protein